MASGGGPIQTSPASMTGLGEVAVLREEAVARMNGVGAGLLREGDDLLDVEVGVGRGGAPSEWASSASRRTGVAVGIGVHGDAADPRVLAGTDHPDRDLATVGDSTFCNGLGAALVRHDSPRAFGSLLRRLLRPAPRGSRPRLVPGAARCRPCRRRRHPRGLPFDPTTRPPGSGRPLGRRAQMHAVTSLMRVQQLVIGRLDALLKPLGLTFARYEALVLLTFSSRGSLPLARWASGSRCIRRRSPRSSTGWRPPGSSYAVGIRRTAAPCSPRSPHRAATWSSGPRAELVGADFGLGALDDAGPARALRTVAPRAAPRPATSESRFVGPQARVRAVSWRCSSVGNSRAQHARRILAV